MKNLLANRPTYTIPEAYQKALGIAQQMASQDMPGMDKYQQMYGEATARAMTGAERGAISSNAYMGAVQSAQDKELQALQQLAVMGAQYKTSAMQNLQGAQTQMGQLQDQAFNYNVAQPYDIKLNMANEQRQAGAQNLWGGLTDIGNTAMNFVGTKYMADVMQGMQGGGASSKVFNNPNQQFSAPLNNARSVGSSGSIMNSASGMMGQPQFPSNYDWMWSNLKKQGYTNG
jgi:hypothetical protein